MTKDKNITVLKAIGALIKNKRLEKKLKIADIRDFTDLTYNTISKIEKGGDIYLSNFLQICFALGLHPKAILDIEMDITPKNSLSPTRAEKSRLTSRITDLIGHGYFNTWRGTGDVVKTLNENFNIKVESKNVSSILRRFSKDDILLVKKLTSKNLYKKRAKL